MREQHYYWFKEKSNPHSSVFPYIKMLNAKQSGVQDLNIRNMRLYGNNEYNGLSLYNQQNSETSYSVLNRLTLNIVQSMIDTASSKITKNKPRPYFLTDGADFTLKRKAEKLTKFAEGQLYSTKTYELMPRIFKDSCIFGTGCMKIYVDNNEIKTERVFIDEIKIDENEAVYGQPRQMHQLKWIHKDVLAANFPKCKGSIDVASNDLNPNSDNQTRNGDMLLVVESWKLPSKEGATDGRHTICINNDTLFDEKWNKCYFPFVFIRWNERPLGFWGQGIAEQLTGLQTEINKLLRTIQVSMHLVSVPKLMVEASSKIITAHLDNKIGGIIKYAGTKPEWGSLGQIPAELFSQLDRLYAKAYEIIGISQLSASSQKPSGLNSGKAMRTYNEIETERFMECAKRYEQAFLDATEIMIEAAKDIAKETRNYKVKVPGSGFLQTIEWKDVSMKNDQYLMQSYPTSALSQTPSSRLAEVQELMQAGLVSKEDGMKLLDFPDLKSFYNMNNSGVEDIERQIELMVDKQEYQTPEPYQDLQYGIKKMQQAYLMYRSQNAPEETLELFRQWISDANELLTPPPNPVMGASETETNVAGAAAAIAQGSPGEMDASGRPALAPRAELMEARGYQE
jgi:hypothetical protein